MAPSHLLGFLPHAHNQYSIRPRFSIPPHIQFYSVQGSVSFSVFVVVNDVSNKSAWKVDFVADQVNRYIQFAVTISRGNEQNLSLLKTWEVEEVNLTQTAQTKFNIDECSKETILGDHEHIISNDQNYKSNAYERRYSDRPENTNIFLQLCLYLILWLSFFIAKWEKLKHKLCAI